MQKKLALILVTFSAIFWGTNFNLGKMVIEQISPLAAGAIRFSLACLFIIPIILYFESIDTIRESIKRNGWMYLFLGIVGVAGFNGFILIGLKHTTAINGALIMATNPLVTILLSNIFLKSSINSIQRIGLFLSFSGVVTVITQGSLDVLFHLRIAQGDWYVMAANVCWSVYCVVGPRYLKNSKPLITTAATMIIGSLVLALLASYDISMTQLMHQSTQIYSSLLYMAFFGSVLAYLFWNYGISHLGAEKASVFFNLVPVVTVIASVVMGQSVTPVQIAGGLIVILGVLLSTNVISLRVFDKNIAIEA